MSEYQYYEFQAIDRPLDDQQLAQVRGLSTRARITPTSFVNHYEWGDFGGDPDRLIEGYFDAFLYLANWGTHWFMLRLPQALLTREMASIYCQGECASVRQKGDFVIVSFASEEEPEEWEDGDGWMSSLIAVRELLTQGDLRPLYLGWLLCAQMGELEDEVVEPALPPGLGQLTASLTAFADFLRIDENLIAVAAEGSEELGAHPTEKELAAWLATLPATDKEGWLLRLLQGNEPMLRAELLQRYRSYNSAPTGAKSRGRTVAELLSAADKRGAERAKRMAAMAERERRRREREVAAARAQYLDRLAERESAAWEEVEACVSTKRPADYDRAVRLLTDLHHLSQRAGSEEQFERHIHSLRLRHGRKPSLMRRLDEANLSLPS